MTVDLSALGDEGRAEYLAVFDPAGAPQALVRLPRGRNYQDVAVDSEGTVWLAGMRPIFEGENRVDDAFVLELAPGLERVAWETAFGGGSFEYADALALGPDGRLYVSGRTASADLPATAGGLEPALLGNIAVYVARLSPEGDLERATYFNHASDGFNIAADSQGFVYLSGDARNVESFPLVNPARDADYPRFPPRRVGYLSKFTPDLDSLVYSTFLGAEAIGAGRLAVDETGRAYVGRSTGLVDPPGRPGLPYNGGLEHDVVERFSPEGEIEETLYFDWLEAITLDADDRLVAVGAGVDGRVPGRTERLEYDYDEVLARPDVGAAFLTRVAPAQLETPYIESVVNAASWRSGPAAPGELTTLLGDRLGPAGGEAFELAGGRLPVRIGGVEVHVGGVPAPLLFAGASQVNLAAPFALEPRTLAAIELRSGRVVSNRIWQTVVPADPGVFTVNGTGFGDGAILNQDGSLNGPSNPAEPCEVIQIFATGGGRLEPPLEAGEVAGLPLSAAAADIQARFGSFHLGEVLYAGAAPGLIAGVLQVNVVAPRIDERLRVVDVKLEIGEIASGQLRSFVSIAGAPYAKSCPSPQR